MPSTMSASQRFIPIPCSSMHIHVLYRIYIYNHMSFLGTLYDWVYVCSIHLYHSSIESSDTCDGFAFQILVSFPCFSERNPELAHDFLVPLS